MNKKSTRKRFNQTVIFAYFNAECEYVDNETRKKCHSRKNLTTHHWNGDNSNDSLENLEILCQYHHRKKEGILNKKRDCR